MLRKNHRERRGTRRGVGPVGGVRGIDRSDQAVRSALPSCTGDAMTSSVTRVREATADEATATAGVTELETRVTELRCRKSGWYCTVDFDPWQPHLLRPVPREGRSIPQGP
ncbi:hypothetical protein GCM10010365_05120 [Streptomyces poonensis]|uniref:Uncharacterized protein n=1 Tax=Streptomyces poonensis TaxID=68255 RepID=A0A918P855_9ACTN|nr:hypothetical protein GCM10010365_05120 [Streptomyces poonensis]GLJ88051.1 hypothetical protein GCM10017589_06510 [Streptomyces poonensis]